MGNLNFSVRFLIGMASFSCLVLFLYSAPDSYISNCARILIKLSYFWCLFLCPFTNRSTRAFLFAYGAMGVTFLIFGNLWVSRPGQGFSDWGYIRNEFASVLMERLGQEGMFRTNPVRASQLTEMVRENVHMTFQLAVSLLTAATAVWLNNKKMAEAAAVTN